MRDKAHDALRASESRYRRLFETAQDGILILNAESAQIDDANPFLLNMLGYTLEELTGKKLWDVGAFKEVAESKVMFKELQQKGYVRYHGLPLITKAGLRKEVEFISNAYQVESVRVIQCNIRDISERIAAQAQAQRHHEQLKIALLNTVEVATNISEMRDPYTAGHERHVALIAYAIGAEMGLGVDQLEGLKVAGYLHDIGKVGIPTEILSKPGRISPVEYLLIQGHAKASYDVLHNMKWPWPIAEVALQHHERMDGSGYPNGLRGDEIILEARILAVADVVEAMGSHRPYRAALGIDLALAEVKAGRGTLYDPVVVDACLKLFTVNGFKLPS
jgi:PAS domain S-box-containing protein